MEKLYTVEEVAELASVTGRTIRNYLKSGRLVGRKIGGQWRFPENEVQRLLNGGPMEEEAEFSPEPPQDAPRPSAIPLFPASDYNTLVDPGDYRAPSAQDSAAMQQAVASPESAVSTPAYTAPAVLPGQDTLTTSPNADGDNQSFDFRMTLPFEKWLENAARATAQVPAADTAQISHAPAGIDVSGSESAPPQLSSISQAATTTRSERAEPARNAPVLPSFSAPQYTAPQYSAPPVPPADSPPPPQAQPAIPPGLSYPNATQAVPPVAMGAPVQMQPGYYYSPQSFSGMPSAYPVFAAPELEHGYAPYYPLYPYYYPVAPAAAYPPAIPKTPVATPEELSPPEKAEIKEPLPPTQVPGEKLPGGVAPDMTPAATYRPSIEGDATQPEFSDVGLRVTKFISEVHDCSHGPMVCAVIDMHQTIASARAASERLADIAAQESEGGQLCQSFVEFDERYYIARYTIFGTSSFLFRCLKLIG